MGRDGFDAFKVQLLLEQAWELLEAGQDDALLAHLRRGRERFPARPEITLWLAHRLLRTDHDEAVALITDVVDEHPDDATWLIQAAGLMVNADETELARPWIARAKQRSTDPDQWPTLELLEGCVLADDGEHGRAEAALRRSFVADPTLDYGFTLARFLVDRGDPAGALAVADAGLALDPAARERGPLQELRDYLAGSVEPEG
jgi:uncharacterized protein HemY